MNILFTKQFNENEISAVLGPEHQVSFAEVISIHLRTVDPFPLGRKSLIFTSVNAVDSFFKNGFLPHENFADRNFNKIYCVGKKTKAQLRKYGFGVFKMKKNAKELSEFIIEHCAKEHFLHFCGNLALNILQNQLPLQNIYYRKIVVYDTHLIYPVIEKKFDAIAFFSPSGVLSFIKNNRLENMKLFAIGETTGAEVSRFTDEKVHIGKDNDLNALLKLIREEGAK